MLLRSLRDRIFPHFKTLLLVILGETLYYATFKTITTVGTHRHNNNKNKKNANKIPSHSIINKMSNFLVQK